MWYKYSHLYLLEFPIIFLNLCSMTDREIDILIKTYDQSKPGVEKAE